MAKWCAAMIAVAAFFALTGCQSETQPVAMVNTLPPPNFDGPSDLGPRPGVPIAPAPTPQLPPTQPPLAMTPAPKYPAPNVPGSVPPDWIPSIRANNWRWIVIHHSATPNGGAVAFDREHRSKGWDELGYHFVIGNGTDTRDGQVEVGGRWKKQKWGAHAKTPDNKYNDYGIGICLVGNFDVTRPSRKQLEAVSKLVAFLERQYNIPPERVIGHGMVHTFDHGGTSTHCPGRNTNIAQIRQMSTRILADAGEPIPASTVTASANTELMYATPGQ